MMFNEEPGSLTNLLVWILPILLFLCVSLWVLISKKAKLYVGHNLIPGVGPLLKYRVGTLTHNGRVYSTGLPRRILGSIRDNGSVAEVVDDEGHTVGVVHSDGRVEPGGRAETPLDWRSKVLLGESDEPVGYVVETGRLRKDSGRIPIVAKGAGAVLLLLRERYSTSVQDVGELISKWDLCFLTSLIFVAIAGPPVALIYEINPVARYVGKDLAHLMTATLLWLGIWGGLSWYRYEKAIGLQRLRNVPLLGSWLIPAHLNRRTGISAYDQFGAIVCLGLSAYLFVTSFLLLPLALAGLVAFMVLILRASAAPWPVYPRRDKPADPDTPEIPSDEEGTELIARTFKWRFEGLAHRRDYQLEIKVRRRALERARQTNPSLGHQGRGFPGMQEAAEAAKVLVEDSDLGRSSFEVTQAARFLLQESKKEDMTVYEEANHVLQFVQNDSIPYRLDKESLAPEINGKDDYFRYPVETIHDQEGDCDCKAILAAAIFAGMGFKPILMVSNVEGHAAVAIEGAPNFPGSTFFTYEGKNYYWCEAAANRAFVGQLPPDTNPNNYAKVPVE